MASHPNNRIPRPPVIAIMGHIDHGKSTLLDYIRKSNITAHEAGGITQHISAYEVAHTTKEHEARTITFLDTPGHEAFSAMRSRGAKVADIAILVVAADDGVKPQTLEALTTILDAKIPYIVAINKIDKPGANIEFTKQSLAESGVYVEGYGGNIPYVPISAKNGDGISDLLDMMVLVAELEDFTGDPTTPAEGVVIETNLDKKKGISATLIIKNGTLKSGTSIVAGTSISPGRIMEDFLGKNIKSATFSSPVRIVGWSELPPVGATFTTFPSKKEAEKFLQALLETETPIRNQPVDSSASSDEEKVTIPLVIKAGVAGIMEAVEQEIGKIAHEQVLIRIIQKGVGDITEADIKTASGKQGTYVIGFSTAIDPLAKNLADRLGIQIQMFDVIYKLTEWLQAVVEEQRPRRTVEETKGTAKILKLFSQTKDRQVIGARVENGILKIGGSVKIMRRDAEIGRGKIRELQHLKNKVTEIAEGREFGANVESKLELAPGDKLEYFEAREE